MRQYVREFFGPALPFDLPEIHGQQEARSVVGGYTMLLDVRGVIHFSQMFH